MIRSLFPFIYLALTMMSVRAADIGTAANNGGGKNKCETCTHIMLCCRVTNAGTTFLVNGQWNPNHDYMDIGQTRDILQKIKDAGINTVICDMTNPSQWTRLWDGYCKVMLSNIRLACREKNMKYLIFIGAQLPDAIKKECGIPLSMDAFEYWNNIASIIWNNWAQEDVYKKFGFGDNRPMIIAFLPGEMFWQQYDSKPDACKTYLSKFYIGTTQINDPITITETDGWGYRKSLQNASGSIRYTSTNGGVGPKTWHKISPEKFRSEVEWAAQASKYCIIGSYDDTCDGIFWGIADTSVTAKIHNKYPVNDPYLYYNIVKDVLRSPLSTSTGGK